MKVLVTGGAGYVGSLLSRQLLTSGHEVRVIDSLLHGGDALSGLYPEDHFTFLAGDVRSHGDVARAVEGMDAVVHLAAIVGDPACARDKSLALEVNHTASLHLFDAAKAAGAKRFIFASTCSNYGRTSDPEHAVDESAELRPVSLYAETKVAVEQFLLSSSSSKGLDTTVLRFATVYGIAPRMRFDLTVNEFTRDLLINKSLTVFGEQFWRPYVHVRDVARAVAIVLAAPPDKVSGQVFNVGDTRENFTKAMLVDKIRSTVGIETTVERVHRNEDPRDYRVDFTRINRELHFQITRTVDDGIRELIDSLRQGVFGDPFSEKHRN